MFEDEETGWRVAGGTEEAGQEEKAAAAAPTVEEDKEEKKEELQQRVQAKAEDLGGEEASLITETEGEEEKVPITDTKYESPSKKVRKTRKPSKAKVAPKKDINLIIMSKQLARIEKVIQSLQNSVNKIDRQSNTIKQLNGIVTQLQRQIHHQIQQQQRRTQKKKGKDGITSPKK
jgi:hypothetical protein